MKLGRYIATKTVWYAVALIAAFFLKEIPLRTTQPGTGEATSPSRATAPGRPAVSLD